MIAHFEFDHISQDESGFYWGEWGEDLYKVYLVPSEATDEEIEASGYSKAYAPNRPETFVFRALERGEKVEGREIVDRLGSLIEKARKRAVVFIGIEHIKVLFMAAPGEGPKDILRGYSEAGVLKPDCNTYSFLPSEEGLEHWFLVSLLYDKEQVAKSLKEDLESQGLEVSIKHMSNYSPGD